MLDPTRYSLDAATVGFRKRTLQKVDWAAFNEALQTQTDSVKVRRELEETPISEIHVMGGERYGLQSNQKTNEIARQQRQMNGYPLRSFYATGGPVILPPKKSDSLLGIPSRFGHIQYTPNAVMPQQWTSSFTEPLNAPLDNKTILLGRAGVQAKSNSLSNPYKALQFQLNMEADYEQIQQVERDHQERRSAAAQVDLARQQQILAAPKHLREVMSAADQAARLGADRFKPRTKKAIAFDIPSDPQTKPNKREMRSQLKTLKAQKQAYKEAVESAYVPYGASSSSELEEVSKEKLLQEEADIRKNLIDAQAAQELLNAASEPFESQKEELDASTLSEQLNIDMDTSRLFLELSDNDFAAAKELYQKIRADVNIDPDATVMAEELDAILNSDAADASSVLDLSSFFERETVRQATQIATPVQVPGTAPGIVYNDNGIPASAPSAGFVTPFKFSPIEGNTSTGGISDTPGLGMESLLDISLGSSFGSPIQPRAAFKGSREYKQYMNEMSELRESGTPLSVESKMFAVGLKRTGGESYKEFQRLNKLAFKQADFDYEAL